VAGFFYAGYVQNLSVGLTFGIQGSHLTYSDEGAYRAAIPTKKTKTDYNFLWL